MAAGFGDRGVAACGGDSDSTGISRGAAQGRAARIVPFGNYGGDLQLVLPICKRIDGTVVLGGGDRGGSSDCVRAAAHGDLRSAGGGAIVAVLRGPVGGDVDFADWKYKADADDLPVAVAGDRDVSCDDNG